MKVNTKKLTGKALVNQIAIPIGFAFLGSIAGAAAGKTANLVVGAGLGAAGIALGMPNLIYAGAGAAVVTPPKAQATGTAGLDGLDGVKDFFALAKNRAFGQTKMLLSNAHLDVVADKIPVSGLGSLEEAHDEGYVRGVFDATEEQQQDMMGLSGHPNIEMPMLSAGQMPNEGRISVEAVIARQMSGRM